MEEPKPRLLDIHRNPNSQCAMGRHIGPVLAGMFAEIEDTFACALAGRTLADCIAGIRKEMAAGQSGRI